jgi:hypothetical protein
MIHQSQDSTSKYTSVMPMEMAKKMRTSKGGFKRDICSGVLLKQTAANFVRARGSAKDMANFVPFKIFNEQLNAPNRQKNEQNGQIDEETGP